MDPTRTVEILAVSHQENSPLKKHLATSRSAFPFTSASCWALVAILAISAVGCGGTSQEDLIARAARRHRPPDPSEQTKATQPEQPQQDLAQPMPSTVEPASSAAQPAKNQPSAAANPVVGAAGKADELAALNLPDILSRRPAEPLTETQRRERAVENLKAVYAAMKRYVDDKGVFPPSSIKSAVGQPGLSWRVELLPYLGYKELYDRFDLTRRWDDEVNAQLLKYIPDEYVSPERFDTSTNIMVPVGRSSFIFDEKRSASPSNIEDGLENTLLLLEVNDSHAAPWTKPVDYHVEVLGVDYSELSEGLGELRGGGTFAMWANGWPLFLSQEVTNEQIFRAINIDGGDSLAKVIHQDIPIEVAVETTDSVAPLVVEVPVDQPRSSSPQTVAPALPPEGLKIPDAIDLTNAKQRFNSLYGNRIDEASTPDAKDDWIANLLKTSTEMTADPAGAYVMQSVAIEMAQE